MKMSPSRFWRSGVRAPDLPARHHESPTVGHQPSPGEVLAEIGLLLAIHLAVAFAIVVSLRVAGIA
jgi:hypothetical protein